MPTNPAKSTKIPTVRDMPQKNLSRCRACSSRAVVVFYVQLPVLVRPNPTYRLAHIVDTLISIRLSLFVLHLCLAMAK